MCLDAYIQYIEADTILQNGGWNSLSRSKLIEILDSLSC